MKSRIHSGGAVSVAEQGGECEIEVESFSAPPATSVLGGAVVRGERRVGWPCDGDVEVVVEDGGSQKIPIAEFSQQGLTQFTSTQLPRESAKSPTSGAREPGTCRWTRRWRRQLARP